MSRGLDGSSLYVAAGAAFGGVVLGAMAMYVGLEGRRPQPPAPASESVAREAPEPAPARACPSAAGLAEAVARTRGAVVSLATSSGSLGAGVVVADDGLVLTNAHVVADALAVGAGTADESDERPAEVGAVYATFEDGRRVRARVLFADPREDLALLRLSGPPPPEGYTVARLGRSGDLAVGEEVFAIGNPFGLGHTVSRGIVSAVDRTGVLRNPALPVLQLDAAINVGNSGGPLFNLDGELVGIVTARVSDTPLGKAEGIAFALPIDHVRAFLRAVREDGIERSGMVGLQGSALLRVPPEVRALGYRTGILVEGVYRGYPAHAAGLRRGDVIVALRDKRLDALAGSRRPDAVLATLQRSVRALFPGETLEVTVVRDGRTKTFDLEVAAARPKEKAKIEAEALFGVLLADGTDVPTIVGPAPRAFRHRRLARRLRRLRGARIVEVMGRKVARLEDLAEVLTEIRDLVERSGGQLRVVVAVERPGGGTSRIVVPVLER